MYVNNVPFLLSLPAVLPPAAHALLATVVWLLFSYLISAAAFDAAAVDETIYMPHLDGNSSVQVFNFLTKFTAKRNEQPEAH